MLVDTVKNWISESRNNFYSDAIDRNLYQIRLVNHNALRISLRKNEALYHQMYFTATNWPTNKALIVLGVENSDSDFAELTKMVDSANKSFLPKKKITAEAVSYNDYNFIVLSCS